ncbi:adenosylcobinamide-GDP ribazoletransferase, partial [bacterium]|nr:adenosylcobinamide-GDP ribazoletransferase [bacterium]
LFTTASFLLLLKLKGAILLILSLFPVFLFINYVKKKIGAMTGDTIGATSEVAEISVLFFALICLRG